MKSTIKIATESRGTQLIPVIKIIQSLDDLHPDCSENDIHELDRLIAYFLHLPLMTNRNYLFQVTSHFDHPAENPQIAVTVISPIEETDVFRTMKNAIRDRLFSYDEIIDINQTINGIPNTVTKEHPSGYNSFIYINEFFEWLESQPYHSDTNPSLPRHIPIKNNQHVS